MYNKGSVTRTAWGETWYIVKFGDQTTRQDERLPKEQE